MDLDNSQMDAMKAFAEKQRASNPQVELAESPVEAKEISEPATEEPVKQVAEEAPKDSPKKEEPKVEEPEVTLSWDAEEEPVVKTEPKTTFDFKRIGSALEFDKIESEDDVVTKVSELKTRLKELEDAPMKSIPDELREVVEVARKSGEDWKAVLAEQVIDYSKMSPLDLYEQEFFKVAEKLQKFRNEDGTLNEQAVYDAIDGYPETSRYMEGVRLQQERIQIQQYKKNQIIQRTQQKFDQAEKSLVQASKNLNELLPFEKHGIKFESKHSDKIYQGVLNSSLTKKHMGVGYEDLVRSGADMKAITRTIAAAEYAEQMIKFKTSNVKVEAKKEILDKVQNVQLSTPGTQPNPQGEQKTETPAERFAKWKQGQSQPGRL